MRMRGLTLGALLVVLVACAEKPKPSETVTTSPPVVTVQPSPPAGGEPPPAVAPRAVTPSPAGPAPSPSPPPASSPSERSAATSVLYISVPRANFREGPDVKAKILSVLTRGTKLTVLEKSAQWYRVRLDDGKEGWVAESVTSAKPD